MRITRYLLILTLVILLACSGGGGGGSDAGNNSQENSAASELGTVVAFNDLGMHCMDREFSIFSILPPFNVINAQVLTRDSSGRPQVMDDTEVELRYDAVSDPTGSINTYSADKTDFWGYAGDLFGVNLQPGEGLTGRFMPADNLPDSGEQPMEYSETHEWFSAEGIPISPLDDNFKPNTYPLMRIAAYDKKNSRRIGYLDVVVPVASETDCQNCHATGQIAARDPGTNWADENNLEVESKKNILILHDAMQGTSLKNSTPVLCSQCHYSPPLDLGGNGPSDDQRGRPTFSAAMHAYHGSLVDNNNNPVFPPGGSVEDTCYQCHPGAITQCQRGAMKTGGMNCNSCHGDMLAVGGNRRPWQDLPLCQSCHTGDALNHLTGGDLMFDGSGIRLIQAYRVGDAAATPLAAVNRRFAEEDNTLFRNSKGHGGLACEACHGSTHAIWPNADDSANDNIAARQLQGHTGTIIECAACHVPGSLPLTTDGPHGLHNVNDDRWIDEEHGEIYENDKNSCKACHGTNLRGTVLAKMPIARTFNIEDDDIARFVKGELVGCNHCHGMPDR